MSVRKAAKKFGAIQNTLANRLKGVHGKKNGGQHRFNETEKRVRAHLLHNCAELGAPLRRKILLNITARMAVVKCMDMGSYFRNKAFCFECSRRGGDQNPWHRENDVNATCTPPAKSQNWVTWWPKPNCLPRIFCVVLCPVCFIRDLGSVNVFLAYTTVLIHASLFRVCSFCAWLLFPGVNN